MTSYWITFISFTIIMALIAGGILVILNKSIKKHRHS
jgi:L-asparagine transporter-like permease